MRALFFCDRAALFALAVVVPVVLGNRKDRCIGRLLDPALDRFRCNGENIRVGQAQLGAAACAFAVYFGKVFGMGFKVFCGVEDAVEGVDEMVVGDPAAVFLFKVRLGAVEMVARRPQRIAGCRVVGRAVFERGNEPAG